MGMKSNNDNLKQIERRLENIEIQTTNHISGIKKDVSCIRQEVTKIGTDVTWLKKFFWLIMSTSTGAILVALFGLILR
jgi:archaellum component FlaC